jgi:hypothetical protein
MAHKCEKYTSVGYLYVPVGKWLSLENSNAVKTVLASSRPHVGKFFFLFGAFVLFAHSFKEFRSILFSHMFKNFCVGLIPEQLETDTEICRF